MNCDICGESKVIKVLDVVMMEVCWLCKECIKKLKDLVEEIKE